MVAGTEVTRTEAILYEKRDQIAWVTLNRPERMNSQNTDFRNGLARAMRAAHEDDDILVAIMYGAGGRAFSAGNDLRAQAERDTDPSLAGTTARTEDTFDVADCRVPVIAAIDGYALAGGMQLALRCDIRIATEKSMFGMPEVRRGRAAVGGAFDAERMIPLGEAKWIHLTGSHMTAKRAYDIGLIQALVPDREALFVEAERVANEVKLGAPLAVEAAKRIINSGRFMPPEYTRLITGPERLLMNKTEDIVEGPRAFAEKRAPVWKRR